MERTAFRTCPLCEASCGLEIEIVDERVKRIRGDRRHVMSAGFICPKGSTLKQLYEDPDRLRTPMIKEDGHHRPASWEEAYALIAERWGQVTNEHGREATAVYFGNPNAHQFENSLALRPLVKALATKNVFSASSVDQLPKHVSAGLMFGHPLSIPVPDLDRTDYLLMLGANPYESNGSLCTAPDFPGRLQRIQERGGKFVVVDPRRTKTAAKADRWIPINPGADAAFLLALANAILEKGPALAEHLRDRVEGFEDLPDLVAPFTPEETAAFTGVEATITRAVARELTDAKTAAVYGRIGTHTVSFGTTASWAVDVLNVITGNLDRPGGAMFPYPSHIGRQRARRPFVMGRWQSRVSGRPEIIGELPVASLLEEIITPGEGQVRMLLTLAGNPALTTPNSAALEEALNALDFMVSVDVYLNETSRHADVVLPPPSALERSHYDLAFTGLSVRDYADYSPPVFNADGPSEFEILVRLAGIFGGLGPEADPDMLAAAALSGAIQAEVQKPGSPIGGRDPIEILEALGDGPWPERNLDFLLRIGNRGDHFGAVPGGLTLQLLEDNPSGIDFGPLEPRLDQILATASGRIELTPEPIVTDLSRLQAAVIGGRNGEAMLVGRRQLRSANSWTHNVEVLMKGKERCTLEVHPVDAERWGLNNGEKALVASAAGEVEVPVEITSDIRPGVVSIPYGWGHGRLGSAMKVAATYAGVNVNFLSDGSIDPVSGNAVLNGIPVTVGPVAAK
ncbi:MAG TPA: molybdopterin-dependent oxidoreductase [Acidimicrobiia bacterium]|nr:molybdopterin-dependent oxidoreductase [Acidimicrobiia bacterium]